MKSVYVLSIEITKGHRLNLSKENWMKNIGVYDSPRSAKEAEDKVIALLVLMINERRNSDTSWCNDVNIYDSGSDIKYAIKDRNGYEWLIIKIHICKTKLNQAKISKDVFDDVLCEKETQRVETSQALYHAMYHVMSGNGDMNNLLKAYDEWKEDK